MIYEGEFLNADFKPAHSDSDFSHHFHHRVCVRRYHGFCTPPVRRVVGAGSRDRVRDLSTRAEAAAGARSQT
jgi:hypothetical protein